MKVFSRQESPTLFHISTEGPHLKEDTDPNDGLDTLSNRYPVHVRSVSLSSVPTGPSKSGYRHRSSWNVLKENTHLLSYFFPCLGFVFFMCISDTLTKTVSRRGSLSYLFVSTPVLISTRHIRQRLKGRDHWEFSNKVVTSPHSSLLGQMKKTQQKMEVKTRTFKISRKVLDGVGFFQPFNLIFTGQKFSRLYGKP